MDFEYEDIELTDEEKNIEKGELNNCTEEIILESNKIHCSVCGYGILNERIRNKDTLIIYTRQGTIRAFHKEKRCNNYRCKSGHWYGWHMNGNEKVIKEDALSNKYLITSQVTGFSIDFLWDITLQIHFSQASFESLGNIYNYLMKPV